MRLRQEVLPPSRREQRLQNLASIGNFEWGAMALLLEQNFNIQQILKADSRASKFFLHAQAGSACTAPRYQTAWTKNFVCADKAIKAVTTINCSIARLVE